MTDARNTECQAILLRLIRSRLLALVNAIEAAERGMDCTSRDEEIEFYTQLTMLQRFFMRGMLNAIDAFPEQWQKRQNEPADIDDEPPADTIFH